MGAGWEIGTAIAGAGMGMASGIQNLLQPGIQRKREDNAVQRRAEDMKAAGINPILAAGNPAQATPIQTKAGDTGALVDYMSKKAAADLQAEQQSLVTEQKRKVMDERVLISPEVRLARNRAAMVGELFNRGGHPDYPGASMEAYQKSSMQALFGQSRDQARQYQIADKYNIPVNMINSPAGQALLMNELLSNVSGTDKAQLLAILAAQSGILGK